MRLFCNCGLASLSLNWVRLGLFALLILAAAPGRAAEISFSGYTNACFGAACVPPDSSSLQTTNFNSLVLNFANSNFSGTTTGGTATLNGAANAFALNTDNLGAMTQFAIGTGTSMNTTLRLLVTFTSPFPTTSIFEATVTGTNGAVGQSTINFNNTPVNFTNGTITFTLTVSDLSLVANGNDMPIVGTINVLSAPTDVPEPASFSLVGLAASAMLARWRLRRRR